MPFTESMIHGSWFTATLATAGSDNSLTHAMACAVYNNTVTPDPSSAVIARYGAGGYAAGEQFSVPGWPAGGRDLFNAAASGGGTDMITATADPAESVGPVTLTVFGDMLYDRASAAGGGRIAFCYHYFGGPVAPAAGLFTVVWAATGVVAMSVPLTPRPPLPLSSGEAP